MLARPKRIIDYREVLSRRGDVAIGAYARAQRRKRILASLGGIGLIGLAGVLYLILRPSSGGTGVPRVSVIARCQAQGCGWEGNLLIVPGKTTFPAKCPKCGALSVQEVWQCLDCKYRFIPPPQHAELTCPRCKSQRVGVAEQPAEGAG